MARAATARIASSRRGVMSALPNTAISKPKTASAVAAAPKSSIVLGLEPGDAPGQDDPEDLEERLRPAG